jgi:hypothetical protein
MITFLYNNKGDTLWTRTYNGSGNGEDEIISIAVDYSGNVYVTGRSFGVSNFDIVTIKYDSLGKQIYLNIYNNSINYEAGSSLFVDNFGNLYVGGTSNGSAVIIKYQDNGILAWVKFLGGGECNHLKFNNLNNLIAVNSVGLQYAYEIYEISTSNGASIFNYNTNQNYNARDKGNVNAIKIDVSNNIYILSTADNLINNVDPVIANFTKFNHRFSLEAWEKEIYDYRISGVGLVLDDSLFSYNLVERTKSNGQKKIYINKISSAGDLIWEEEYFSNLTSENFPSGLAIGNKLNNALNQLLYTGFDSNGDINLFLISKVDGNIESFDKYSCILGGNSISMNSNTDPCDNIYITGYSTCNNTGQDVKTIKYSSLKKPKIVASKQNPICENETITLYADKCGTCTYNWSNGSSVDSINIDLDTTAEYSVTITNENGCETVSFPYKVVVNKLLTPTITVNSNTSSICIGSSATIIAQSTSGGLTPIYQWYVNGNAQAGVNGSNFVFSPSVNSQIYCVMTTSEKCYTQLTATSNNTSLIVNPLPIANITADGSTTFCQGNAVNLLSNPAVSYQWNNGGTNDSLYVTQAGIYSVVATDQNGCTNKSNEIIVNVNALPSPVITPNGNTSFCFGGSVTLTSSNGASYLWSNGATANNISVNESGNFSVLVIDGNGCKAISPIMTVTVNNVLQVDILSNGDSTLCRGQNVVLTSSVVGNLYSWSNGQSTPSITINSAGVYQLSVTDANGCTGISNPFNLIVYDLPLANVIVNGKTNFCDGESTILLSNVGQSYSWSNGSNTQSIEVTNSGEYVVTVTDKNGCSNSSTSTKIVVYPLPNAMISPSGIISLCEGNSSILSAEGGTSYLWSNGSSEKNINVNLQGNYHVEVTDANGCTDLSASTIIKVDTLPNVQVTIIGELNFCEGGSVILKANNAETYLWSNGATTQSINVNESGTYKVIGTNTNGCSKESEIINVSKLPAVTPKVEISTPDQSVCEGQEVVFSATGINGGLSPEFKWFVNNIIQSETSSTFRSSSLLNGSSIYCIMTSSEKCLTSTIDNSNTILIAVNPKVNPSVFISASTIVANACDEVIFSANPMNGGFTPTFRWFVNKTFAGTGQIFRTSELANEAKVHCVLSSSAQCKSMEEVNSDTIEVQIKPLPQPILVYYKDTLYSSNYISEAYKYKWYSNGIQISNDKFLLCSIAGIGSYYLEVTKGECSITSATFDLTNCSVSIKELSEKIDISIYPNPTNGKITITSSKPFHNTSVNLINIYSQELLRVSFMKFGDAYTAEFDLDDFDAGIYFIKIGDRIEKVFKVN